MDQVSSVTTTTWASPSRWQKGATTRACPCRRADYQEATQSALTVIYEPLASQMQAPPCATTRPSRPSQVGSEFVVVLPRGLHCITCMRRDLQLRRVGRRPPFRGGRGFFPDSPPQARPARHPLKQTSSSRFITSRLRLVDDSSRHQPFPSPSPTYPSPQSKSANPPRPTSPHPKLIDTSRAVALLSGVPIDAYYVNHLLVCSTYQPALVHHIASLKGDRHQAIRQDAPCQLPDTPLSWPPSSVNCLEFAGSSSRTRACDGIHHDRASISRGCHSTGTHALCIVRPTITVL